MASTHEKEDHTGAVKPIDDDDTEDDTKVEPLRFPPEEEAKLRNESNDLKLQANKLFGAGLYSEAIQEYNKALASCPNYLDYETAVLQSNIAACHLNLKAWKDAVTAATSSIESLDRLSSEKYDGEKVEAEEVKVAPGSTETKPPVRKPPSLADIQRIKTKSLLRRAKARSEQGGWSALQGADEDYKLLFKMENLPPADRKTVQLQMASLPARLDAAKEAEVGQMMGKLKELGNGILKPFGLSTDNFNMIKDPATGGYSMQFNQGNSGKK